MSLHRIRVWAACVVGVVLALSYWGVRAQVCGAAGGDNRPDAGHCASGADLDRASPAGDAPVSATRASIDLVTGNKYLRDTDARWPDGLVLVRHYNSRHGFSRTLGAGWSHSWDTALVQIRAAEVQVIQGDGRRRSFHRISKGPGVIRYHSADPQAGQLVNQAGADTSAPWQWRLPDGRVLQFDRRGQLLSLQDGTGTQIDLARDPASGRLQAITNAHGIALRLTYDGDGRLSALQHPDGGLTRYHYDAHGLLARVQAVDGKVLRYAYDADSLRQGLTRIVDDRGATVGVFEYDEQGRATASRMAAQPGLRVAYRLPSVAGGQGETTVTHERDGVTRYRWLYQVHAHRALILGAVGPGCAICPPAGVSRRYDTAGRVLQEDWHQQGRSITWQRDALGRVVRMSERAAHGHGHGAGQFQPARSWRFVYRDPDLDSPLSALIAPSIAPGREHSVRWQYDRLGRVVARNLSGFSPELASLDSNLVPVRWRPIERRTRFGYVDEGPARGRLVWFDGPLPGEADRTGLRYDNRGRLVGIDRPAGLSESRTVDRFGRLIGWTDANGMQTQIRYDAHGAASRIERAGVVSEWSDAPDGELRFSVQGRVVLGLHRDAAGRVDAFRDASGALRPLPLAGWPAAAVIPAAAAVTHAAAAVTQAGAAAPASSVAAAGAGQTVYTDQLGAHTREWRNDFGELVAAASPQGGLTLQRHDATGHVLSRWHESGAVEHLAYDAAGRLLTRGDAANPQAVRYVWAGERLVSVSDQVQTIEYEFDQQGQVSSETVAIGTGLGAPDDRSPPMQTRWQRDRLGQVIAQRLPGGHGLGIARDSAGRPVAIALHSADGQRVLLADGLRYREGAIGVAGLAGYRAGNGVQLDFMHDTQQRLVAIAASQKIRPLFRRLQSSTPLFHQRISYDAFGKISAIVRDGEAMAYRYDVQGRLIGAADRQGAEGFAYDANGNRLVHLRQPAGAGARVQIDHYAYDPSGRLLHIVNADESARSRWLGRTASGSVGVEISSVAAHAGGPAGATAGAAATALPVRAPATPSGTGGWADANVRGVIRGVHGRAVAAFADGRLLAVYDYDARGLRVRGVTGESEAQTALYLYQDGLVTGVADPQGRLRRWIVRLGAWPLAELHFENGRLSAVHWLLADQRGAPLKALDSRGDIVWQARYAAFGAVLPGTSPPGAAGMGKTAMGSADVGSVPRGRVPADPGLRLAGQWFDPETGRHENGWRSYIPEQGRYAQPDPLGPRAGPNERAYAGSDPIGRVDPRGLYEVDVHYYLTYFLARVAGVTPQRSHMLALAAQYVDDNPITRPETVANFEARALYHFVMVGHDRTTDPALRFRDPGSPQLTNLLSAAHSELATECARVVFLGEYLHTFEDTFSHRDQMNVPFQPYQGHLRSGHDPDQTYDVVNSAAPAGSLLRGFVDYTWNDERSMRMAQETYGVLQRYFGSRPVASFAQVEGVVHRFNQTGAKGYADWVSRSMRPETSSEYSARKARELRDKIAVLDTALVALGLGSFRSTYADASGDTYQAVYRSEQGARNRGVFMAGLSHGDDPETDPFRGILLPGD